MAIENRELFEKRPGGVACRVMVLLMAWLTSGVAFLSASQLTIQSPEQYGGNEPQKLVLDVSGMKRLALITHGKPFVHAVWGAPVLVARDGSRKPLADLKPVVVEIGDGRFAVNEGPDGRKLQVGGKRFKQGFFVSAGSRVEYRLDGDYARFETWTGISHNMGTRATAACEICDGDYHEWRALAGRLKRGFTRECLQALRRELWQHRMRGPETARRADALLERLAVFERDFDVLRRGVETTPDTVREPLTALDALVREIHLLHLDTPLLFVKRHPYRSVHIHDDYLTWHPGGGIYVIENPAAPPEAQTVRAIVDPSTPETLGKGVYRDPDISHDGKRLLFAFKGSEDGDTSIHEIGSDGRGLRRLTNPGRDAPAGEVPRGLIGSGHHDLSPCYLPDGRIAFTSTRSGGLVLCFNNRITTLHTMNGDGSDIHRISVNNVSEFDPTLLPDGRLLFCRWEYLDKTALYMQGLWTVNPDGTGEAALFKNNLAKPTAVLDARPVPGTDLIAASLTPHNGEAVGAIAMIDPALGKNSLEAIRNFTPEYPTEMDQWLKRGPSDPWPLSENVVLIANNSDAVGLHGVIEMIDRFGFRSVIRSEPDISCYSPMLIRPRPQPIERSPEVSPQEPGRFFVQDLYRGMDGIQRGEVAKLRILEMTRRTSGVPEGGRWWNQGLLISWQGSYDIKNVLGTVPVEADGSAWFDAPSDKALYFQALDRNGRLIQSMRTFVQAVPGVTRSCYGCHVNDDDQAPGIAAQTPAALRREPSAIAPETWGAGPLDYPSKIQPVLDRHCVRCHGGADDIAGGVDLSGGWTWAFNLSYETLLKNALTGFLNCDNGAVKTAEILPPRTHGSGVAPLATLLLNGHGGRLKAMQRAEADLLLVWMDGNCNYYGSWAYTRHATCDAILDLRQRLLPEMAKAGCTSCHEKEIGNDWINLQTPERSRILRAPLAKADGGLGLAWCRDRKARPIGFPLVTTLHASPDVFSPDRYPGPDPQGKIVTPFSGPDHPIYQTILGQIRQARSDALKSPRVDMPDAKIIADQSHR